MDGFWMHNANELPGSDARTAHQRMGETRKPTKINNDPHNENYKYLYSHSDEGDVGIRRFGRLFPFESPRVKR